MKRDGRVVGDILQGALAGAAATWLMTQATTWMYEQESEEAKARENEAMVDRPRVVGDRLRPFVTGQ